jgi:glyoxylase-like metal-dependent hydrolase (beta-lactamase superfamily II)
LATRTNFDVAQMRVHILDDGVFVTDAGNLFGGSRKASIKGAMHPVLVEAGDSLLLIDAGFGPELPEILVGRYELRRDKHLLDHLERVGYSAGDVTHVILSHLDADHVGWALGPPSFPSATVYVQEAALEEARRMPEKDGRRAAVPTVEQGVEDGWCELLDSDEDVLQGVKVEVRAGHSAGHQSVWLGEGDVLAL